MNLAGQATPARELPDDPVRAPGSPAACVHANASPVLAQEAHQRVEPEPPLHVGAALRCGSSRGPLRGEVPLHGHQPAQGRARGGRSGPSGVPGWAEQPQTHPPVFAAEVGPGQWATSDIPPYAPAVVILGVRQLVLVAVPARLGLGEPAGPLVETVDAAEATGAGAPNEALTAAMAGRTARATHGQLRRYDDGPLIATTTATFHGTDSSPVKWLRSEGSWCADLDPPQTPGIPFRRLVRNESFQFLCDPLSVP